jgi:beta-glucosidase
VTPSLAILLFALAADTIDQRVEKLLSQMTLQEKLGQLTMVGYEQKKDGVSAVLTWGGAQETEELQRAAISGSRLKIPLLVGYDVIHGYRTTFPIPLAMASTWDPQLAEESARIAATEARAAGIRWTFAPMVDIARDPRWGRIAEGAGEDPYLGSAMAAAYVRGFHSGGLLACAKHYAAYGAAEGGRDYDAADMSERKLREVYLPPFKAAVDAGVDTIMSAFDALNGVPATANRHLLTEILRDEWKFRGFVVNDFTAVAELLHHGIAGTPREAAVKAITAGVDMDMVDETFATLPASPRVDEAVRRILRVKFRAGLFDSPHTDESQTIPLNRAAARRIAQRSIVLLKNEGNILPLAKSARIAIVGPLADSREDMLGPWCGRGSAEETISVDAGVAAAAPGRRVEAADSDIILAVLGETRDLSGEASSRSSLDLPGDQQKLLESLVATGKPVVLVVMSGRPLTISWAAEHVPAIVQAWFLGTEGGNAIADVLFGDVNPSGKLPVTVPRSVGQVPIYYSRLPTGRPADPQDKYTNKYLDLPPGPLYPFGFGLSYTRFEYSDLRVDGLTISALVRNAGARAGDEIAQLYINQPVASVSRPLRELKGFRRIALAPGESKRVTFTLTRHDLEFWSERGWTFEPGKFNVWIGPDSERGLHGELSVAAAARSHGGSY